MCTAPVLGCIPTLVLYMHLDAGVVLHRAPYEKDQDPSPAAVPQACALKSSSWCSPLLGFDVVTSYIGIPTRPLARQSKSFATGRSSGEALAAALACASRRHASATSSLVMRMVSAAPVAFSSFLSLRTLANSPGSTLASSMPLASCRSHATMPLWSNPPHTLFHLSCVDCRRRRWCHQAS